MQLMAEHGKKKQTAEFPFNEYNYVDINSC